ncbi:hypothetical protein CleRT_11150 [Candidatus Coxiella mudrowiae]|uniref:Uncharacterized protein n=1 Tax=Candidatus Coxiella mudrowiae TaxID=2054173 RepID=A0ABN4HPY6_9COXI|nr:hypothetical protein CleRT_11150 [Candidatus Coxiella mudrowiae]
MLFFNLLIFLILIFLSIHYYSLVAISEKEIILLAVGFSFIAGVMTGLTDIFSKNLFKGRFNTLSVLKISFLFLIVSAFVVFKITHINLMVSFPDLINFILLSLLFVFLSTYFFLERN